MEDLFFHVGVLGALVSMLVKLDRLIKKLEEIAGDTDERNPVTKGLGRRLQEAAEIFEAGDEPRTRLR